MIGLVLEVAAYGSHPSPPIRHRLLSRRAPQKGTVLVKCSQNSGLWYDAGLLYASPDYTPDCLIFQIGKKSATWDNGDGVDFPSMTFEVLEVGPLELYTLTAFPK